MTTETTIVTMTMSVSGSGTITGGNGLSVATTVATVAQAVAVSTTAGTTAGATAVATKTNAAVGMGDMKARGVVAVVIVGVIVML